MKKRRMIHKGLVNNSVAAFRAALEIHNKPDFSYRYETVSLLLLNAWELALKAYVRKYAKKSIFEDNGHTISFSKALNIATERIEIEKSGSFSAIKSNLELLLEFRNKSAHFYSDETDPVIFALIAKASMNYTKFMELHFGVDPLNNCNMTILPLGFKLPFKPEGFLSRQVAAHNGSEQFNDFLARIVNVTNELNESGIDDSVLLGFSVQLYSTKKVTNADIIATIINNEESVPLRQERIVRLSDDPSAQPVSINDDEFFRKWPLEHAALVSKCRERIPEFKQDKRFTKIKEILRANLSFACHRTLDRKHKNIRWYYSEKAVDEVERLWYELASGTTSATNANQAED